MKLFRIIVLANFGLLVCPLLQADPINWTVTLDQPELSGAPGTTLLYRGEIVNNTGSVLVLDSLNLQFTTSLPASSYIKDYSDDFLSTLGVVPISGYSGPLFYIQWGSENQTGTGTGTFDLVAESPATPLTLDVPFSAAEMRPVRPPAVTPEPASLLLCLSGCAASWAALRRRATSAPKM